MLCLFRFVRSKEARCGSFLRARFPHLRNRLRHALTCICCKTLEHILVSNINNHLALDNILADCQHCFQSQRSCATHLVQFVHDIISNLGGAVNRGHKQTDLIIMDFAKAFDKVPHRRLLHKLEYYGIRGATHKLINSWLSGRTQQVVLDGQCSVGEIPWYHHH